MWKCLACGKCLVFAQTPVSSWFPLGKVQSVSTSRKVTESTTHSFFHSWFYDKPACMFFQETLWVVLCYTWIFTVTLSYRRLGIQFSGRRGWRQNLFILQKAFPGQQRTTPIAGTVLPSICPIETIAIQHLTLSVGQLNLSMIVETEWQFWGICNAYLMPSVNSLYSSSSPSPLLFPFPRRCLQNKLVQSHELVNPKHLCILPLLAFLNDCKVCRVYVNGSSWTPGNRDHHRTSCETFPFDYCLKQMELISSVISLCTTCHCQWLICLPTK